MGAAGSPLVRKIEAVEALRKAGDFPAALDQIERIVAAHPRNARAVNELGILLRLLGDPWKASIELRKARKLAPDSPEILANLAGCLREQGEFESAVKAYRKAIELRPDFAPVFGELGETYHAMRDAAKAAEAYERSLQLSPLNAHTLTNLASALGELGEPQRALDVVERSLGLDSLQRRAMVVKAFALHELGREQEAAAIFDLDWVRAFPHGEVQGFESLGAFNRALVDHVEHHPTLEFEPANRSTTKGEQTGELLQEPKGPVAQLELMIQAAVKTFLDDLPRDPEHPYLAHRPRSFRLNVWGTRLGAAGHQSHHIHPGGWVSGVYYAQLPDVIQTTGEEHAGWIQFGGAPDEWRLEKPRPLRDFQPEEGTLFLFPSYFYHRTIPFESETKRVSIAFDAIPED